MSHFTLNMMNERFHFLNFQEFINELGEIRFPLGKMEFSIYFKICAYHRTFDLRKGPANTLTPLSPNVNNANINKICKISFIFLI